MKSTVHDKYTVQAATIELKNIIQKNYKLFTENRNDNV